MKNDMVQSYISHTSLFRIKNDMGQTYISIFNPEYTSLFHIKNDMVQTYISISNQGRHVTNVHLVYYVYLCIYVFYGWPQGRLAIVAKRDALFKYCINKSKKISQLTVMCTARGERGLIRSGARRNYWKANWTD